MKQWLILIFLVVFLPAIIIYGQTATVTDIIITNTREEIRFSIQDLTVKGMKGRQIQVSFWVSQEGKWLADTGVSLDPESVKYDPAFWNGEAYWFSYTYGELEKAGNPGKPYWGTFFVQDPADKKVLLQENIEFNIPGFSATDNDMETDTDTGEKDSSLVVFKDDFSKNILDDTNHYVRFGPAHIKVKNGLLRMEVNANQGCQMELLNIFPCFGRESEISLKARWADGDGACLFIGSDWHYRHSGRKTHFYLDFNRNQVIAWNTDGTTVKDRNFKKGEWVTIRIERTGETMSLYVDNQLQITKKLDALSATENTPGEAEYGAYFLETDTRPYLQVIEIDDLVVRGVPSPVQFGCITKSFNLDRTIDPEAYRFSVIYEKGLEQWAAGQLEISIPYIRTLAGILGIPPMSRSLGMVSSRGKYYDDMAGFNNRGVVYQKGDNSLARVPCSHELAHNWYTYYGKKWMIEGSADFCMLASTEITSKHLMTAADFLFNIEKYSNEAYLKSVEGYYLDDDEKTETFFSGGLPQWDSINKTAWKQRVFFYMIYRSMGEAGFRKMHSMMRDMDHGISSQEFKNLAEKIKGRDLSTLFNGWVFPGKTGYPVIAVFLDSDSDGLSDLDEMLFGTNTQLPDTDDDGYGDRSEIAAGFNPQSTKSPGSRCVLIDGSAADWPKVDTAADPRDAGGCEDIKTISFFHDKNNKLVFILAEFWNNLQIPVDTASWNYYFTVDFDTDSDSAIDYRVNLFFNRYNSMNAHKTNGFVGNKWNPEKWTVLDSSRVTYCYRNGLLEASVPLELIGDMEKVQVHISSGSPAGTDYLEKAPVTINVIRELLKYPATIWHPF